jgi:segregation and condensation protein A
METISFKLPGFEGPLDLLLHLVQKHKLNIMDIPISELLEQYTKTIDEWRSLDLEVASEFLEMAARLVYIKTAMLLPKHEEAEQMREELSGELMEYQLCKELASRLADHNIGGDIFVRLPTEIEPDRTYRHIHSAETLVEAYLAAAGRGERRLPPPAKAFSGIVSRRIVSVSSKIIYVLRRLYKNNIVRYSTMFEKAESRSELVATFLALLELVKANRILVNGEGKDQVVCLADGLKRKNKTKINQS